MNNLIYWSPFIGNVGTIKSCLNSAIAAKKFSKGKNNVKVINVHGEWNNYLKLFHNNGIEVINFYPNLVNYFPKSGYIKSRIFYVLIFTISLIPLLKLLKKEKDCFFIAHLITSLPLFLNHIFNLKCKMILRISGYPKLNFVRKLFWKITGKKVYLITCPTKDLQKEISSLNILDNEKLKFLPDAIINIKDFLSQKLSSKELPYDKKIILSVGRLTKQKNFKYLINELNNFLKENKNYILIILGDGEEKKELKNLINKLNLNDKVFLLGFKDNPLSYMLKADIFVLSSLWEEVGFVIVEAALSNLLVVSSDCPNGPKEFLSSGKAGFLFENNKINALKNTFSSLNENNNQKKILAKKNSLIYTRFRHYLVLKKLLSFQ